MAKQSPAQRETVERVMHEFKEGDLERRDGRKVRNPKQAIAIALHEAGASNQESPAENRRNLRHTKTQENARAGSGEPTRQDLMAEARKRDIQGRSRMTKAELKDALKRD